jgi:hypothetical protein
MAFEYWPARKISSASRSRRAIVCHAGSSMVIITAMMLKAMRSAAIA